MSWRSLLARAIHYHREPHSRYVQLATVSPDGMPHNRTIVFRGFLRDTDTLKFVTDNRSKKAEDIKNNAKGELCWYFSKTREQFRLAGSLELIEVDHPDRTAQWQELSAKSKAQFFWATPGLPRLSDGEFLETTEVLFPPANFCLLLLHPKEVDHLNLRGNPQTRTIYQHKDSVWEGIEVNP